MQYVKQRRCGMTAALFYIKMAYKGHLMFNIRMSTKRDICCLELKIRSKGAYMKVSLLRFFS